MHRFVAAFGIVIGLQGLALPASVRADGAGPASVQPVPAGVAGVRPGGLMAPDGRFEGPSRSPSAAAPAATARSRFSVTVPTDDAELLVDGVVAKGTGGVRVVQSAPLERGKRYEFTFAVTWWPNGYTHITRSKTVPFAGGDAVSVDLTADEGHDRAEVRYIPTPDYIVAEMIKLAGITPDDVVYEPGCGDARTTIAAVKAGAKRGVGIDIDAARVAESRANVLAAGLGDRVEIGRATRSTSRTCRMPRSCCCTWATSST